jgi:L-ascorbate metabolism protein UlaG (beta-lactamase superfamily)
MPAALQAKTKVMKNGDKGTFAGVPVEAVVEYNTTPERMMYHPKGRDNGYVLTMGGKRIYLAGDTEEAPELKNLPNIDVAFVPMNLPYTMTTTEAADCVKAFKPKVVYPYHYMGSDLKQFEDALKGSGTEVRIRDWYAK